jgi:hypothetical protein
MKKYEEKLKHLRRKYRESEEDKLNKVPDALEGLGLEKLTIFNKQKYEEIKTWTMKWR